MANCATCRGPRCLYAWARPRPVRGRKRKAFRPEAVTRQHLRPIDCAYNRHSADEAQALRLLTESRNLRKRRGCPPKRLVTLLLVSSAIDAHCAPRRCPSLALVSPFGFSVCLNEPTAAHAPRPVAVPLLDRSLQPHLDQMQHMPVDDAPGHRFEEVRMRDRVEGSGHRLPIVVMFRIR